MSKPAMAMVGEAGPELFMGSIGLVSFGGYVVFPDMDLSSLEDIMPPPNMDINILDGEVVGLNGFDFDGRRLPDLW